MLRLLIIMICVAACQTALAQPKPNAKSKTQVVPSGDEIRAIVQSLPADSAEEIQLIRRTSRGAYFVELVEPEGRCKGRHYSVKKTKTGLRAFSIAKDFPCETSRPKESAKNDGIN